MSNAASYKVPPDGGYGWVVTFAFALNNIVVLPLIASFGLVFQEAIDDTGLTITQGTLIIVLNHSIGMLLSFFGGPLLRRFGYRKVAVTGALLISGGLMLTSAVSNFWLFLLSYSIINSSGVAAVMAAFNLAINSFFKEKRARAIGVGMSITGLGTICMPFLIDALMEAYNWRYTVLILGAICLHSLLGAFLLRPAKWYLIDPPSVEEMQPLNKDVDLINGSITTSSKPNALPLESSLENGIPQPKSLSMRSLTSNSSIQTRNAISHPDVRIKSPVVPLSESRYKWWESQEINLGSSINIFHEDNNIKKMQEKEFPVPVVLEEDKKSTTLLEKFIEFFDLTLLRDPIFVNILFGLSIAACVEINFSLLLPIILKDMMKYGTRDIAILMGVIGLSDTLFRLVAPFIGEWCHKPPRFMYMISLLMIIFVRSIMLITTSFSGMVIVALAMGITKGLRTVYMNIVIPTYVPIHRLAFASGIQMFFNGITIITIGSLLARVRELSGSYKVPIIILNVVTMVTILLWSGEFLYFKIKKKPQPEQQIN